MRLQTIARNSIWTPASGSHQPPSRRELVVVAGALGEAEWDLVRAFAKRLSREDVRLRFGYPLDVHDEPTLRRAFDIKDDVGEMIWVLDETAAIVGLAHRIRLLQTEAEIALIVRSDRKRRGIGEFLLRAVLARSARQGFRTLYASVLWENRAMLRLAAKIGYAAGKPSAGTVELTFGLERISDQWAECA